MPQHFTYIPVASSLHDERAVSRLVSTLAPALAEVGGSLGSEESVNEGPAPLPVVLTGGTERRLLELYRARQVVASGEPLFLVTHPGHNSMPAALETLARVRQDGGRGRVLYLPHPEDRDALDAVATAVEDLDVRRYLHEARIGAVGPASDWLVASNPPPEVVRATWGPEVVPVGIEELVSASRRPDQPAADALAASVQAGASAMLEPVGSAVQAAAAVFPALGELVERYHLTALTVRCFDLVTDLGTSGCLALSELNDRGVVAGCEGDLVSTIGMLWLHRLLGLTLWMANPVQVDASRGALRLAHCTVARSLVSGYRLRSHFESGLGVGIEGDLPLGDVTLLRLGGNRLDELWTAEGESVAAPLREDLCRTQLQVLVEPAALEELLWRPLGNHVLVAPGHHRDRITGWWQTMIANDHAALGRS